MIEVKTVVDKIAATAYLRERNVGVDLQPLFVMCATENGMLVGVGGVSMDSAGAVIETIVCDDNIEWLIGKALLNSLDLGGIRYVKITEKSLFSVAKQLRFLQNGEEYILDLKGYFEAGCNGCAH